MDSLEKGLSHSIILHLKSIIFSVSSKVRGVRIEGANTRLLIALFLVSASLALSSSCPTNMT